MDFHVIKAILNYIIIIIIIIIILLKYEWQHCHKIRLIINKREKILSFALGTCYGISSTFSNVWMY